MHERKQESISMVVGIPGTAKFSCVIFQHQQHMHAGAVINYLTTILTRSRF